MLAGGCGGLIGDMFMHSLDTVKTRQQGDPNMPPKYGTMTETYRQIFRQEGFRRGLYSGVTPAMMGSFPGTVIFFGTYEWTKRQFIDRGMMPTLAYAGAGLVGDFAASFVYVPSEVLKTRLQLQGRFNNPFFYSGYNYKGTFDAARTIVRTEGISALFYGYKATIFRDLPFSALQFTFYEQEQRLAKRWCGNKEIGLPLEIFTGMSAGGAAGVITCPLDVVKTRIQTQVNPTTAEKVSHYPKGPQPVPKTKAAAGNVARNQIRAQASPSSAEQSAKGVRSIATSSPSTSTPKPGSVVLDTSSVFTGLKLIYKTEGIAGWFRGVGPRLVWTSVQSGCMFVVYQQFLSVLDRHPLVRGDDDTSIV